MNRLVTVSNRVCKDSPGKGSTGGLAVGVMAAMEQCGGVWFGWNGEVNNTPEEPKKSFSNGIEYVTVGLTQSEYQQYYEGMSNSVLWPVFHQRPDLMAYHEQDYLGYLAVNRKLADQLVRILKPDDIIWVHDYHLIPLGRMLRERGVHQRIGFFLHIPFPAHDSLRAIPYYQDLLENLVEYDLIGFQSELDRQGFRDSITFGKGGRCSEDGSVQVGCRSTRANVYPIGIETETIPDLVKEGVTAPEYIRLRDALSGRKLIVGVDRLDYSKGLAERFSAYEELLRECSDMRRQIMYLQIAPLSRESIDAYRDLASTLDRMVGHIMGAYGDFDWTPLCYLNRSCARSTLMAFYRLAKVGVVTPLRDGMNLVAKEYVAAQEPEDPGVLVLSRMAGACDELQAAVIVNPYDSEGMARSLKNAINMPLDERKDRWDIMMTSLRKNDIYHWSLSFSRDLRDMPLDNSIRWQPQLKTDLNLQPVTEDSFNDITPLPRPLIAP